MVASKKDENAINRPPARTPQGRENQLIGIALDSIERRMLSGTASSQELVHFAKLATERERLERLKIEQDTLLAGAKLEQLAAAQRVEELYSKAMDAFRGYQPSTENEIE